MQFSELFKVMCAQVGRSYSKTKPQIKNEAYICNERPSNLFDFRMKPQVTEKLRVGGPYEKSVRR